MVAVLVAPFQYLVGIVNASLALTLGQKTVDGGLRCDTFLVVLESKLVAEYLVGRESRLYLEIPEEFSFGIAAELQVIVYFAELILGHICHWVVTRTVRAAVSRLDGSISLAITVVIDTVSLVVTFYGTVGVTSIERVYRTHQFGPCEQVVGRKTAGCSTVARVVAAATGIGERSSHFEPVVYLRVDVEPRRYTFEAGVYNIRRVATDR